MDQKHKKSLKEVWVILENTDNSITNKIPRETKEFIYNNMDKDYKFSIDINKSLKEQNLMKETKGMITAMYNKYVGASAKDNLMKDLVEVKKQSKIKEIFSKIFSIFKKKSAFEK